MANPQKENGYTPISNELLEAFIRYRFPQHTDSPTLLWLFVARKTYGYSKPEDAISLTQFEKGTGLPRKTVVYWLNYLVTVLLLVKKEETKNGFIYAINKDYDTWKPLVTARQLVTARSYTSNSAVTKTSYSAVTHINKKQYNKNNGESFETFWKNYPNKKGKGAAEKAWSRVPQDEYTTVLKAVEQQRNSEQWQKDGGRFIPHPTTWLNQKRWLDEEISTPELSEQEKLEKEARDLKAKYGEEQAVWKFLKNRKAEDLLKVKHIIFI